MQFEIESETMEISTEATSICAVFRHQSHILFQTNSVMSVFVTHDSDCGSL